MKNTKKITVEELNKAKENMKKLSEKDLQTQTREDIYNRLSTILMEAEEYWRTNNDEMIGYENELYSMLVRIQNSWEEITADIQESKSDITMEDIISTIKEHKNNICYSREIIQEIMLENEDGETEATLEVYYTDDGYIYNAIFTDEQTGGTKQIYGAEIDEFATKLFGGENPLLESTI